MWEDEINTQGGEFQINFYSQKMDLLQTLWERLIFRLVTGVFPHTDLVCGVRFVDKSKEKLENFYRIEVWVKFGDASIDPAKEIKEYMTGQLAQEIYENADATFNKNAENRERWVEFKPHNESAGKAQQYDKHQRKGGPSAAN